MGEVIVVFRYIKGSYNIDVLDLFFMIQKLDINKKKLMLRSEQQCNNLLMEVVCSVSLEIFKARMDRYLFWMG